MINISISGSMLLHHCQCQRKFLLLNFLATSTSHDICARTSINGDNLYRLTLTSLTPLEHASWTAPEDKINTCQNKGQSPEDCHNYIKVLLSNGKSLFTCGTYAFSPWCTWREFENGL
ncbi:semaphorin-5A-like isoform X1 [Vespula maculifrons]|uniref:Semaphorin-5A-like isoform X1 n=1 Tax=Vespula maculifrons TaxID=7453 RepID=A0ABD2CFB2_VESMC